MHAPEDWKIRYAQCWEDADILLEALDIQPGQCCVSIASAGDNTLAMLARNPGRVVAVDVNPAQLACLELRVAAFRSLSHEDLLELIGSRPSVRRSALYARCRPYLSDTVRRFWDGRPDSIVNGIGSAGSFERYLCAFRRRMLPLIHSHATVEELLRPKDKQQQAVFYGGTWDSWRWRLLFRIFFSRLSMRRSRSPRCFRYVEGNVSARILQRIRRALSNPSATASPYLDWILTGSHRRSLPFALRPENFDAIRRNLDHLELRCQPVQQFLAEARAHSVDAFNLSDIFEYVPMESYHRLLESVIRVARRGARLAYWNMLAPRSRPESMADRLAPVYELAHRLTARDKAPFYGAFVVEEVL